MNPVPVIPPSSKFDVKVTENELVSPELVVTNRGVLADMSLPHNCLKKIILFYIIV